MNAQNMAGNDRQEVKPVGDPAAKDLPPTAESLAFAATLRAWRLHRGITQDDLAERSGVSKSSISMAERAFHHHPPKEITQSRIATALGITVQQLRTMPPKQSFGEEAAAPTPVVAPRAPEPGRGVTYIAPSKHNAREVDGLQLPSKWVLGATDDPAPLTYFTVTDTAMQPTIRVGDVAILEPCDTTAPGIYLVGERDHEGLVAIGIRRVTPTTNGKVRISCDNERFDRAQASPGELSVLAKVLFIVRTISPD